MVAIQVFQRGLLQVVRWQWRGTLRGMLPTRKFPDQGVWCSGGALVVEELEVLHNGTLPKRLKEEGARVLQSDVLLLEVSKCDGDTSRGLGCCLLFDGIHR